MKKLFLKHLAAIAAFMGFKPDAKEPLNFSAEDKEKLDKAVKKDGFAEAFMEYYNNEYLTATDEAMEALNSLNAELKALDIKPAGEEEEEEEVAEEIPTADEKSITQKLQSLSKKVIGLAKTNAQMSADLEKIKKLPEDDNPEAIVMDPSKAKAVKFSNTHLFASNNEWDKLDRSWNKNVVDALQGKLKPGAATVWDKVNIDKLNSDLGAYSRRNSNEIMDLLMDGYDIPAHWSVVSNIQDEFVFASIVAGQITQTFKKAYLPKNKQRFVPVKNKIYDKQIDGQWQASELKSIEKSWLNMFFNEGSTPYKDSFARYLIEKLLNQARKEDKISIFKGVYSDPELQPTVAGDFINSMSGFLKLVSNHRGVDYQPHNLAKITSVNAYTVITDWVKNLPIDIRNSPLKLGLGNDVWRWYVDGREASKGLIQDYVKNTTSVEGFPNVMFVKHPQLEGTNFVYITTEDNIGLMVDRPGEESIITVEKAQRAIDFFADWKLGVFFKAFGANVDPNAAVTYSDQIFFSNNEPLLTDVYVPVAANDATPSLSEHNALKIGSNNTAATDITNFDDAVDGQYVYLYGDSATNVSTVKNNANIILDGGADFALDLGNTMVLIATGGKFVEYSRTVAAEASSVEKVTLAADATTADANDGTWFVTQANTVPTAFTNITNAIVDEVYTLEGGSATNSTTVASSGNFLLTASFTASVGAYLKVVYNGSKFVEVERG